MRKSYLILLCMMIILVGTVNATRINVSCTNLDDLVPIVIGGGDGFLINGDSQIVWSYCSGNGTAVYYNDSSDYTVTNDTTKLPMEVESGTGTSFNPENLWSDYDMIYHLNENPGGAAPQSVDSSTTNSHNGTADASMVAGDLVTGVIGNAWIFDGVDEDVDVPTMNYSYFDGLEDFTISYWVNYGSLANLDSIFSIASGGNAQFIYWYSTTSSGVDFSYEDSVTGFETAMNSSYVPSITGWELHTLVFDGTNDFIHYYINDTDYGGAFTINAMSHAGTPPSLEIMSAWETTFVDGILDELRLSNTTKTASYVNQTYQNVIGTVGFGDVTYPLTSVNVTLLSPDNNFTTTSQDINFTYNATSTVEVVNCSLYIDGVLNETIYSSDITCYQLYANVSTDCGGVNSGYYNWTGEWNNLGNTVDGDWGTSGNGIVNDASMFINYTKPSGANNAVWEVKDGDGRRNLSIPQDCWDNSATILELSVFSDFTPERVWWRCKNGTSFYNIDISSSVEKNIYEEAIIWNTTISTETIEVTNIQEGMHNWSVNCTNLDNKSDVSETRDFYVDLSEPVLVTNYVNGSIYYLRNLTGQFNFTDNIDIHSVSIDIDQGARVLYNKTGLGVTALQLNISNSTTGLTLGLHNLTVRFADGHTAKELLSPTSYNPTNTLWNNELIYQIRKPYPTNNLRVYQKDKSLFDDWQVIEKKDRFSEIYKPATPSSTQTFIVESLQKIYIVRNPKHYGGVWMVTGEQWKDFVLENEPDAKISVTQINDYKVEVTISNIKNTEELIFNSVGDVNIVTQVYNFSVINLTETYDKFIYNDFETRLTLFAPGLPLSGYNPGWINWNNTLIPITTVSNNGTVVFYQFDITPGLTISDNTVDVLHNWTLELGGVFGGVVGTNETTTQQSQQIVDVDVGLCGVLLNYTIINFSYYDEVTDDSINLTNAYDLAITDGTFFYNQTGFFTNNTNDAFCTNVDLNNATYNWDMWGSLTLSKAGYITKVMDLSPSTPIQLSNDPSINMSLFIIGVANSSTVTYNWFTNDFFPIDGTMRIYRCEPDSSRTLLDSITVISGVANANIQLLTETYAYDITINGVTYTDLTGFGQCHVESQTDITYFVDIGVDASGLTGLAASSCTLTLVTNTTVFMQWAANLNNDDPVQGCLQSYRKSLAGNVEVYNNCTESPPFNRTVTFSITGNEYVILGSMKQGNYSVFCDNELVIATTSDATELYGLIGLLSVLFLVAAMTFMFAENPTIRIASSIVGLISVMYLGLLNVTWLVIGSIITLMVIILMIGRYSRKQ